MRVNGVHDAQWYVTGVQRHVRLLAVFIFCSCGCVAHRRALGIRNRRR